MPRPAHSNRSTRNRLSSPISTRIFPGKRMGRGPGWSASFRNRPSASCACPAGCPRNGRSRKCRARRRFISTKATRWKSTRPGRCRCPPARPAMKVPEAQADPSKVLAWKLSWTVTSPSEVTAKLDLALLKADLSVEETRDFQASCHHLEEALQDGLSFQTH